MKIETIKLHEGREDVTLTTYLIDDSREMLNGKKRPAVIVCPGGAYCFCSDREGEPIALRYASMGYHAFVLRYSVYMKGQANVFDPNAELVADPESLFPAALIDLGAAVLYVKDHADELGVDPDKIVLSGFSAGAHNSALYCTRWDGDILTSRFNRPAEDFRPAGAVLGYGYYDWVDFREKEVAHPFQKLMNEAIDFGYFGTKHPSKEQLAEASPAFYVSKNTPPMFMWTTCEDRVLPSEQTLIMGTALARAGVSYEIHTFQKGDHGFALADQATAGCLEETNVDAAEWMILANKWLVRNVPIDLPEKKPNPFM